MYFLTISKTILIDSSTLFCGAVGKITLVYNTLPVSSTIASLQPVLKAGSQPNTVFPAIGGCIRSCFKFWPNTEIAPSSAFSVKEFLISLSMAGFINLVKPSSIASFKTSEKGFWPTIMDFSKTLIIFSSGISIFTLSTFSFSPRLIANIL